MKRMSNSVLVILIFEGILHPKLFNYFIQFVPKLQDALSSLDNRESCSFSTLNLQKLQKAPKTTIYNNLFDQYAQYTMISRNTLFKKEPSLGWNILRFILCYPTCILQSFCDIGLSVIFISTIKYQIIAIINHVPSVNDPNEVIMWPFCYYGYFMQTQFLFVSVYLLQGENACPN